MFLINSSLLFHGSGFCPMLWFKMFLNHAALAELKTLRTQTKLENANWGDEKIKLKANATKSIV